MSTPLAYTYSFSAHTPAKAAEVQANFDKIRLWGDPGQLVLFDGSGVLSAVDVDPTGDVAVSVGGKLTINDNAVKAAEIGSLPACRLTKSTNQSIHDGGTNVAVTFDEEQFDTDAMHTGSNAELTVNTAGLYVITASVLWASNSDNRRSMGIVASVAGALGGVQYPATGGGFNTGQVASAIAKLQAAETIKLMVWQDSGAPLNVLGGAGGTTLGTRTALAASWIGEG